MAVSTPATPFRTTCALDKHGTRRVQHILDQCRSWVGDLRDILRLDSHLYLAFRYVWSRSVREPVEAAAMSHWPRVRGGPTDPPAWAAKHKRPFVVSVRFLGRFREYTGTSLQRGYAYLDDGRHLLINIHHQT